MLTMNYNVSVGVKKMYTALLQTGDNGMTNTSVAM